MDRVASHEVSRIAGVLLNRSQDLIVKGESPLGAAAIDIRDSPRLADPQESDAATAVAGLDRQGVVHPPKPPQPSRKYGETRPPIEWATRMSFAPRFPELSRQAFSRS